MLLLLILFITQASSVYNTGLLQCCVDFYITGVDCYSVHFVSSFCVLQTTNFKCTSYSEIMLIRTTYFNYKKYIAFDYCPTEPFYGVCQCILGTLTYHSVPQLF